MECSPVPRLRKEVPHVDAFAVDVAVGRGLATDGVGLSNVHGLPPAFGSDTSISFALQSLSSAVNEASLNHSGRSMTLYGVPA